MRSFIDLDAFAGRMPFSIVTDLRTVDTGRGSEALHRDKLPGLLTSLADRARVASIEASSAIGGVAVDRMLDGSTRCSSSTCSCWTF